MKLFTYQTESGPRVGAVLSDGRHGVDLTLAETARSGVSPVIFSSMQSIIEAAEPGLEMVRKTLEFAELNAASVQLLTLESLSYLSPLPEPEKLLCFSVYEKHMKQSIDALVTAKFGKAGLLLNKILKLIKVPASFYRRPTYYKGNTTSFIGHKNDVHWPSFPESKMDYELEMAVIIGKKGKDIRASSAMEYVWGYTIFNDFSARERLIEEVMKGKVGPLKSKDFHTGNALGPWVVTADEIKDPQNLWMKVSVNGAIKGQANTADMHYSISQLIEAASEGEYVIPGEVIATGAAGDGTGIESWSFLNPGDVIRLEIENLGSLENRIIN